MMKKIVDCTPGATLVLVEMLDAQEILGTTLVVPGEGADVGAPQAYILKVGAMVDVGFGYEPGQRVLLQGSFVPVPDYGDAIRPKGLVNPHDIKAVLEESNE